uniref:Uncharacterized protein n=1 Tax=Oryza sativa subsp. japonica TaxID=39947 RepID=Q6K8C0_ORYSJ|nr:hypothetical protein [Oryza sativa Japonica Group]BAD21709.1 hypothetical protein [Oryza sativa Japonica Group]
MQTTHLKNLKLPHRLKILCPNFGSPQCKWPHGHPPPLHNPLHFLHPPTLASLPAMPLPPSSPHLGDELCRWRPLPTPPTSATNSATAGLSPIPIGASPLPDAAQAHSHGDAAVVEEAEAVVDPPANRRRRGRWSQAEG